MLAPHHAENAQLGQRRLAAQRGLDPFIFVRRDAVVFDDFWGDGGSMCRGHKLISILASFSAIPSGAREPYSHRALLLTAKLFASPTPWHPTRIPKDLVNSFPGIPSFVAQDSCLCFSTIMEHRRPRLWVFSIT